MLQLHRLNNVLSRGLANLVRKLIPAQAGISPPVDVEINLEEDLCTRRNNFLLGKIKLLTENQRYLSFFFFLFFCSSIVVAAPAKKSVTFTEYLTQEKAHLTASIQETKQPIMLQSEKEFDTKMKQVSAIL